MKVLRWDITVWWKPLVIWCRLAFWEETIFLAWFPYWLLTACWYLLFSLFSPTGSTLTSPQASEDPLKSKSPILMSRGSTPRFVVFASENRGPAWRNYPQQSLVSGRGGGYHSYFPPSPRPPFLISPSNLPQFLWVTFTREQLGKWLAEEDVWENVPEQAITFDKAIVPVGEEEESYSARALLVMKNAMKEGTSLWSQPVTPTMYSTTDTAVVHQAISPLLYHNERLPQLTDLNLG